MLNINTSRRECSQLLESSQIQKSIHLYVLPRVGKDDTRVLFLEKREFLAVALVKYNDDPDEVKVVKAYT